LPPELRPEEAEYHDSRAATVQEYRRRGTTLQEYYQHNPELLPQLPFTWHHGWRRWKLFIFIFLIFIDACAVPIALYYGMAFGGDVEGWVSKPLQQAPMLYKNAILTSLIVQIIFAVVTTIWGGPTYLEFGIRSIRLVKKERFYRPLGTNSRWCFDALHWSSVLTITVVTALFIVGSAPHIVWLRVLCMPAPAILYCLGGILFTITMWSVSGKPAPFRISSTGKGQKVHPGVYYFIEDTIAVNATAGRPYREALAARYEASPRFRRMIYNQSLFWSIPALILAIPLTVIAVINDVPAEIAYGICKSRNPHTVSYRMLAAALTQLRSRLGRPLHLDVSLGLHFHAMVQVGHAPRARGVGSGQRVSEPRQQERRARSLISASPLPLQHLAVSSHLLFLHSRPG